MARVPAARSPTQSSGIRNPTEVQLSKMDCILVNNLAQELAVPSCRTAPKMDQ